MIEREWCRQMENLITLILALILIFHRALGAAMGVVHQCFFDGINVVGFAISWPFQFSNYRL